MSMTSRRSNGMGSLSERPTGSGRWTFRYTADIDPVTGKQFRRSATITAKTRTAAQSQANRILTESVQVQSGSKVTVGYLLEEWMRFQKDRGRSPTTLYGYQGIINRRLLPAFSELSVDGLTPHHLETLYSSMTRDGLSPASVKAVHRVISASLNQAVKWGWIERNRALRATLPDQVPPKLAVPTPKDARALITGCRTRDELLGAFVFIAAVTGCRRGEVAALRWSSIQGEAILVSESVYEIRGEAGIKSTKAGRERTVHLDEAVLTWLGSWHRRCLEVAEEWKVELAPNAFVFSSRPDGSRFVHLDTISREFRKVADELGMPSLHLHSLRHFAATELLAAGISAKDTADLLGHADPSLTLRIYAHARVDRQRAAAGVLADAVSPPEPPVKDH